MLMTNKDGPKSCKIQGIQQVSALYSEHIYRKTHKNFVYETQLEKIRAMYDNQKRQKRKLIKQIQDLKQKQGKMEQQREILSFAFDTLSCKLDNDGNQKSKVFLDRLQKNVSKSKADDLNRNCKNDQVNASKIRLIRELKKNFDMNENYSSPKISGEESKLSQVIMDNAKIEQLESEIGSLQKNIENLKDDLNEKQFYLLQKSKKIENLQISNEQKDKSIQERDFKIEELKSKIESLNMKLKDSEGRNEEQLVQISNLQIELRITHETYHEREQKEKQCVRLLQNFSKQLKLNDEKVKEFVREQFPDYCVDDISSPKKNYQQHLSYVLHLYKKKETLYEEVLDQLRKRMRQSDLRTIVLEKKLNNYYQLNKHLQKCLQSAVSPANQLENLRKIILDFNK